MDSLFKNLGEYDFKHLSQELDCQVLDLFKQKLFYPCEYMSSFEKFNKTFRSKNEFYNLLSGGGISDKEDQCALKFEMTTMKEETMKDHHNLHVQCNVLLLTLIRLRFLRAVFSRVEIYLALPLPGPPYFKKN